MAKKRSLNPMDSFRKEEKHKEQKKTKLKQKIKHEESVLESADPSLLKQEITRLEKNKELTSREKKLMTQLKEALKGIETTLAADAEVARKAKASSTSARQHDSKNASADLPVDPKLSVYYDAVFNPFGAAPPGLPMRYRSNTSDSAVIVTAAYHRRPRLPPTPIIHPRRMLRHPPLPLGPPPRVPPPPPRHGGAMRRPGKYGPSSVVSSRDQDHPTALSHASRVSSSEPFHPPRPPNPNSNASTHQVTSSTRGDDQAKDSSATAVSSEFDDRLRAMRDDYHATQRQQQQAVAVKAQQQETAQTKVTLYPAIETLAETMQREEMAELQSQVRAFVPAAAARQAKKGPRVGRSGLSTPSTPSTPSTASTASLVSTQGDEGAVMGPSVPLPKTAASPFAAFLNDMKDLGALG